jgi:hypothetical protein
VGVGARALACAFTRVAVLIQHAARSHYVVGRVVTDVSKGPDVSLSVEQLKKNSSPFDAELHQKT